MSRDTARWRINNAAGSPRAGQKVPVDTLSLPAKRRGQVENFEWDFRLNVEFYSRGEEGYVERALTKL